MQSDFHFIAFFFSYSFRFVSFSFGFVLYYFSYLFYSSSIDLNYVEIRWGVAHFSLWIPVWSRNVPAKKKTHNSTIFTWIIFHIFQLNVLHGKRLFDFFLPFPSSFVVLYVWEWDPSANQLSSTCFFHFCFLSFYFNISFCADNRMKKKKKQNVSRTRIFNFISYSYTFRKE